MRCRRPRNVETGGPVSRAPGQSLSEAVGKSTGSGREWSQRVDLNSNRLGVPLKLPRIALAVLLLTIQLLTVGLEASP